MEHPVWYVGERRLSGRRGPWLAGGPPGRRRRKVLRLQALVRPPARLCSLLVPRGGGHGGADSDTGARPQGGQRR